MQWSWLWSPVPFLQQLGWVLLHAPVPALPVLRLRYIALFYTAVGGCGARGCADVDIWFHPDPAVAPVCVLR